MSDVQAVLVVGARGASLWLRGHALRYPASIEGHSALARDAAGLPVRVLLDVMDEEFRREPLPGLGLQEASTLLAQRAQRVFPPECRVALQRLHATEGQLSALTEPLVLVPWLQALQSAGSLLVGIQSIPMLGSALARHCRIEARPALLVFATREGGLRQLLLDVNGVRVARLSPLAEGVDADVLRVELQRFLRFLAETNVVATQPEVVCLLPPSLHEGMRPFRCLEPNDEVGERIARDANQTAPLHADALLVSLLRAKTPKPDYAIPAERAPFLSHRRRVRIWRAALGLLAMVTLSGVGAVSISFQLLADARRFAAAAQLLRASDSPMPKPSPVTLSEQEVAEVERLAIPSKALPRALSTVGGVLQQSPVVMPQKISWRAGGGLALVFALEASGRRQRAELDGFLQTLRRHSLVDSAQADGASQQGDDGAALDAAALSALAMEIHTVEVRLRELPAAEESASGIGRGASLQRPNGS